MNHATTSVSPSTSARWRPLHRADGSPGGSLWTGNPVHEPPPPIETWPEGRVVAWSGSLAADDPFAEELRNWMAAGREALEIWCDRLVGPLASTGRTLLIRPHARQLLSDVAGVVRFLRRHRGERFGMAIAPLDLLTEEMRADGEEHLARAFEVLRPMLDPDRDLLISPAVGLDGATVEGVRERCREAAATGGLELLIDEA